jgi:membrane protease YdiL (CAAX protease family)
VAVNGTSTSVGPLVGLFGVVLLAGGWATAYRRSSRAEERGIGRSSARRRDLELVVAAVLPSLAVGGAVLVGVPPSVFGLPDDGLDPASVVDAALFDVFVPVAVVGAVLTLAFVAVGYEVGRGHLEVYLNRGRAGLVRTFLVALPAGAVFDEVVYRASLGTVHAATGVDPAVLVVGAAVPFALQHRYQGGTLNVVVTGAMGLVFGWAFFATGSLLAVVLGHLLFNVLNMLGALRRVDRTAGPQ